MDFKWIGGWGCGTVVRQHPNREIDFDCACVACVRAKLRVRDDSAVARVGLMDLSGGLAVVVLGHTWMRPERNVAAFAHASASSRVDGPDTPMPSSRLHTAVTILSTDAWC